MCYHYSAQVISRADGRSAVAAAAYRATEKLVDTRTGETHDFSKKEQATFSEIMLPANAPKTFADRQVLWDTVEATEKRKDAQLAREFNIALPIELTHNDQVELMRDFAQKAFVSKGMIADINLHNNEDNPHFHAMVTMRSVDENGFGQKNRDWNKKELLLEWRKLWADVANEHLVRHGHEPRLDHRSLEAQGIDREPQIHHGGHAIRIKRNQEVIERNALVIDLKSSLQSTNHELDAILQEEQQIQVTLLTDLVTQASEMHYTDAHKIYVEKEKKYEELLSRRPKTPDEKWSGNATAEAVANRYKERDLEIAKKAVKHNEEKVTRKTEALADFYDSLPIFQQLRAWAGLDYSDSYRAKEKELIADKKASEDALKHSKRTLKKEQSAEAHKDRLTLATDYISQQLQIREVYEQWYKDCIESKKSLELAKSEWQKALDREQQPQQQLQQKYCGMDM